MYGVDVKNMFVPCWFRTDFWKGYIEVYYGYVA